MINLLILGNVRSEPLTFDLTVRVSDAIEVTPKDISKGLYRFKKLLKREGVTVNIIQVESFTHLPYLDEGIVVESVSSYINRIYNYRFEGGDGYFLYLVPPQRNLVGQPIVNGAAFGGCNSIGKVPPHIAYATYTKDRFRLSNYTDEEEGLLSERISVWLMMHEFLHLVGADHINKYVNVMKSGFVYYINVGTKRLNVNKKSIHQVRRCNK